MTTSQNGWPVVGPGSVVDRAVLGVEFPNGWLRGDVDVIFTYLIGRLHREVEPMVSPGCWGWFVKNIEGGASISNHASGTAIDYNAPVHPMGVRNTYSAAKRARIRAILADLDGTIRWGGDYTGRPDDMHFEIHANTAAVKRMAAEIRGASAVGVDLNATDANAKAVLDRSVVPKDGAAGTVTALEALRQAQVAKNRITELCTGAPAPIPAHMLGDDRSIYEHLRDIETTLATHGATLSNIWAAVQQLTADAADEPNIIVKDVRFAIANP